MTDVILVVGCTGAGKTTYARRLADETSGIRFSIDEWMGTLFWMDSPAPIQFDWTMERIARCEAMIMGIVAQVTARGRPAILDLGFTKKAHRDAIRAQCAAAGLTAAVHFLDVDAETRWQRVQSRNVEKGETFAMPVDRAMFDFMEGMWEPPLEEEWTLNGGQRIGC